MDCPNFCYQSIFRSNPSMYCNNLKYSQYIKIEIMKKNIIIGKNTCIENVHLDDYCIIGNNVSIGEGTVIGSFTKIHDNTIIGKNNVIKENCVIGAEPQDSSYDPLSGFKTVIGDENIFSAFVVIGKGSQEQDTIIGNNNYLMNYVHIAHDCKLGNKIIIVNGSQIAGHVHIEDGVRIGGLSGVVEFTKIGKFSMIAAQSKATKDVAPFSFIEGNPARLRKLNTVGLKKNGIQKEELNRIKKAFDILFREKNTLKEAIRIIEDEENLASENVQHLLDFIKQSKKGIIRYRNR